MGHVVAAPEMLASTAADLEHIGSAISAANAAAAGPTTGLLAAAHDEVSIAIAKLFGQYGDEYQAVVRQAAAFHGEFTQALAAAGNAYAGAEATNVAAVSNELTAFHLPVETLLGGAPTGAAAATGTGGGAIPGLLANAASPGTDVALIMGGTWTPDPDAAYLSAVNAGYIQRLFPGATSLPQFTPEQFWPVTPQLGNMTFGTSVAKGVELLNASILDQVNNQGHSVAVFGYSQSATVATNEIRNLMAMGTGAPSADDLSFVLVGNPNNPDGGLLQRFKDFYIPFLNVDFNGATPPDSPYPTSIYTMQYDGVAHAPRYPLNVVSDLNALLGYHYLHSQYPFLSQAQLDNAVLLPTSPDYTGNTQYYMLMTQDLPLLQPLRDIPYVGPPIADVFQPVTRVIVDLGYGDLGTDYANIPTPAGLLAIPNVPVVAGDLVRGAIQGPYGAAVGIGVDAGWWGPELLPDAYPWIPSPDPNLHIYLGQPDTTGLSLLSGAAGDVLRLIPSFS